jgi:formamidopyrimidine-DNA glycosylase
MVTTTPSLEGTQIQEHPGVVAGETTIGTNTVLPHRTIESIEVLRDDLLRERAADFAEALQGSRIRGVRRRGKNVVVSMSQGQVLVVNLGMTGRLLFAPNEEGATVPYHLGVRFHLGPSGVLYYADVRRFGRLLRYSASEWARESARLGPEPLDGTLAAPCLHQALARSRSPIRSWLLDQTRIAGIGNIYACEALFRASLHPQRAAETITAEEARRLMAGIRSVLLEAIEARGTTLRDYRTANGDQGGFGPALEIYGRENLPCFRCNTPVRRIVFGNRSAFFCPKCQSEE